MLANCEKMVAIPPTTNQWPQNQIDDGKVIMEKQGQELMQQQALKCPRCDSSNTKFCYYNNYSLSQPRHFCKACKRYWTRGGTLRNVPVGGGYRRNNKRGNTTTTTTATALVKRPISTIDSTTTSSSALSSTLNHISPMFYGLSRLSNSSEYDFHPQMNSIGLGGFSSSGFDHNGFTSNNNNHVLRYDSSTSMSVMPSTLLQYNFNNDGLKYSQDASSNCTFQGLEFASLEHMQRAISSIGNGSEKGMKKVEGQNQIEHVNGLYDPSSFFWNDQGANIGSSVTSLI
ncbi:hypothetical protein TSUD_386210 [Trifolium subterraneum]|uniref:Dof zinc finger protein n=1 Tax=Trifolium subterraneum TaxID=3900 RepID=A0A2Z6MDZ9_TRISU|nr:hypothetical protein TSUD_386210 [Trifolium subterraneum]